MGADREIEKGMKETQRAENLIKYKEEIKSRPKKAWGISGKRKLQIKKDSKEDLKHLKSNFNENIDKYTQPLKKREQKQEVKQGKKSKTHKKNFNKRHKK